jgi:kumamolisin
LVEKFALEYGLRLQKVDHAQRVVELDGTVAALEKAFGVIIKQYGQGRQRHLSATGTVHLPARLQKVVTSVQGLHNLPLTSSAVVERVARVRPTRQSAYNGYSGAQMAKLYHFPANTTGKGQCIGLVELNGGYSQADLQQYFQLTNGGPVPEVVNIQVAAVDTPATGFKETSLDLQVAASAAPGARYAVYFGQNTKSGFLQALKAAVHDSINQPSVISISWGSPELYWSAQEMAGFEEVLQDAALLNVTIILSTGDLGSTCGVRDGGQHVQFPASSPYALAIGGTSVTVRADTINNEVVWSNFFAQTGGGFSTAYTSRPAFQQPVVPDTVKSWTVSRGIPDASFHADNYAGYLLVVNGQPTTDGGTSAAAPLCAALIARLNEALGVHLGYVTPLLYDAQCRGAFRPTTQGSNGGYYSARSPWNPCTGLGSADGERLLRCLRSMGIHR